jgi:hypothetical protein
VSHVSDMDGDSMIREGLAAWKRGDLDALQRLLDPAVTLRALTAGPWECESREQVMSLLRQPADHRRDERSPEVDVQRVNHSTLPVPGYQGRTLLHVATDWPGYLPNGPEIVRVLIEHGADPNPSRRARQGRRDTAALGCEQRRCGRRARSARGGCRL